MAPLLAGCVQLGWSFGPGLSMRGRHDLFAEAPVVEHRGQEYFLTWKQGYSPFFFEPAYRAFEGRLVFALAASASSGNLAETSREVRIVGDENVEALQRGGAYWWEPEPVPRGSLVPLKLVEKAAP
jgi:hypothetical protein